MLTDEKITDDPRRALQLGVGMFSPMWPTFIAVASAGVAFWTWAQWARGRAQNEFAGAELTVTPPAPSAFPPVLEPVDQPEPVAATLASAPGPDSEPAPIEAPTVSLPPLAAAAAPAPMEAASEPVAVKAAKPARARKIAPARALETSVAEAPLIEVAAPEPVLPPLAESETAPPPTRKPRALAASAMSPRQARAAKAAGAPLATGPKRRGSPPRRNG